ncbi:hypothetical protein [Pedobacter gandavensis]|uniref:DUF4836 family protein n=1 Tax=Pedobacter gandavensis TaxID=2679963 RepID=A0ABR6ERY2_9SPHI|nr:hypothetical protein [Pedobacter gandavensis]MBB2147736.1 hypothetical protein [Pedobacter gandavensis]
MNYYFKSAIAGSFLLGSIAVNAQDLSRKIPADALAVATLRGGNLTELMSVSEFNQSFLGKKMLEGLAKDHIADFPGMEDFGFNLSSDFFYYNQSSDSVSYNCFLLPVKDAAKIDLFFSKRGKIFTVKDQVRSYFNVDSTEAVHWNAEMLLSVIPIEKSAYFKRPEVRERLGLSTEEESNLYAPENANDAVMADSAAVDVTEAMEVVDEQEELVVAKPVKQKKSTAVKHRSKKTKLKGKKSAGKNSKKKVGKKNLTKKKVALPKEETAEMEVSTSEEAPATFESDMSSDTVVVDTAYADNNDNSNSPFFSDLRIKRAIMAKWTAKMSADFFAGKNQGSILNNADFNKSVDHKAEATIWISGLEKLTSAYLPLDYFKGVNFMGGYGAANAKLFLEDQSIRMSSAMTFSEDMGNVLRKVHKRKLNKKFMKYVNEDQMIGYMAYAMDTKAYLQEYPKLISKIYGSVYSDEIGMATDLFSLLLDEEAIGKVIKGDGIFVFNGLSQKEVAYKSYDYNEDNFETKEVMKTKKETLPDFLMMISTEDTRLMDKLIAYGVKKELLKNHNNYYEVSIPKSPMALYFTIKDGVIFLTTNGQEIQQIVNNTFTAKLSAKHKKALLGNNYAAYFSPKKLSGKIPAETLGRLTQVEKTNKTLSALGDIYIRSFPMKGNTFAAEISMDIPRGQKNALKYLMSITEDLQK